MVGCIIFTHDFTELPRHDLTPAKDPFYPQQDIIQNHIHGRNQNKGDACGEQNAESKGDCMGIRNFA